MDTISNPVKAPASDRIKLPFTFDVEKMQAEIEKLELEDFIYYDSLPLRAPAHLVDTTLPFPPPAEDYADGSWTPWMDTPTLKKSTYFNEIVDTFQKHTKVTLVRLLRLEPGAVVKEHTDPTLGLEVDKSVIRLTIPILTNEEVAFYLNDAVVPMNPGECWYLRLTDVHRVTNLGKTQRVNMTIDMIPNEWIRSIIEQADQDMKAT